MKQWFAGLLILLSILGFVIYAVTGVLKPPALQESGALDVSSLDTTVQISRTPEGYPVIEAATMESALFAFGFAHARDYLWQLEMARLAANSQLGSVFGGDFTETDKLTILLTSDAGSTNQLSEQDYRLLESYANGINQYIESIGRRYPVQFALADIKPGRWSADDVIRYYQLTEWLFQTRWQTEFVEAVAGHFIPRPLHPYISGSSEMFTLPAETHEPAFWLLEQDKMLRTALNAPTGIQPIRALFFEPEIDSASVWISHQSGTSRTGFWMHMGITLNNVSHFGATIPGLPVFWSGVNSHDIWFTDIQQLSAPDILSLTPENCITRQAIIQKMNLAEILYEYDDCGLYAGNNETGDYAIYRPAMTNGDEILNWIKNPFIQFDSNQSSAYLSPVVLRNNKTPELRIPARNLSFPEPFGFSDNTERYIKSAFTRKNPESEETAHISGLMTLDISPANYRDILVDILNQFEDDIIAAAAIPYLFNWDLRYSTSSVAASLYEGVLFFITRSTLQGYLPAEIFEMIESSGYVPRGFALNLLQSISRAQNNPGVFSPVDSAFILRRMHDTASFYTERFGDNTVDWRWGHINSFSLTDELLCNKDISDAASENRICRQILGYSSVQTNGGKNTLYSMINNFPTTNRPHSFTTHMLGFTPGVGFPIHSLALPGYTGDPIKKEYTQSLTDGLLPAEFQQTNLSSSSTLILNPVNR